MGESSPSQKAADRQNLGEFVESIVGADSLRVEEDFGGGFVRLRHSEADLRQAAQDIRSTEDIVIELLRNSRDACADNIYIALCKDAGRRCIIVIDDGCGIPPYMHERIFQPRVTSKLDTARSDRWGLHGRGMALFSIAENASSSQVLASAEGLGAAIKVVTDTERLPEKADQSTFPRLELKDGVCAMRGPRNVLRTVAEFALDQRGSLSVFCGSETEIAAALYMRGVASIAPSRRIFNHGSDDVAIADLLGMATDPKTLAGLSSRLGMEISERSARRIMDGQIAAPMSIMDRISKESIPQKRQCRPHGKDEGVLDGLLKPPSRPKISNEDLSSLADAMMANMEDVGQRYYLGFGPPKIVQRKDRIVIEFPFSD